MRDIIDERDEKARIGRSIVKSWNVNYVTRQQQCETEAARILEELGEEAAAGEAAKRAEIEAALEEARIRESHCSATTGACSGAYGNDGVSDEDTKGRIDKILHERTEALRSLVEQTGHGDGQ